MPTWANLELDILLKEATLKLGELNIYSELAPSVWHPAQRGPHPAAKQTSMNALLHSLARFVHLAYWYCCDFMVNLGNITHTSYNEANTWILLVLIPGLLALLIGVRVAQWFRLWQLRRR